MLRDVTRAFLHSNMRLNMCIEFPRRGPLFGTRQGDGEGEETRVRNEGCPPDLARNSQKGKSWVMGISASDFVLRCTAIGSIILL